MEKGKAEIHSLQEICHEAKERGRLTEDHLAKLKTVFGQRFSNAWEAIEDSRIKRYIFKPSDRVVWIVVGRKRDYLILPAAGFCSCDDFYYSVMEGKAFLCYHLIAQKLAEALGRYDQIEDDDDLYEVLMKEWKEVTS
jgi:predicted nucleic acid-binding Zn finger protein